MKERIKGKVVDFVRHNFMSRIEALSAEQVYQQIFFQQCANAGIRNDFYPVGAAASYSLLYVLARILAEQNVMTVIELGSGETTRLVDRLLPSGARHVCYEEDAIWHGKLAPRLEHCDYRLRPLVEKVTDGIRHETYDQMEFSDFDLLIVDGPRGVERHSRFACVDLARKNKNADFVIIFDDGDRPGERETIAHVEQLLREGGRKVKVNGLQGRTGQMLITSGRFQDVAYYY